MGVLFQGNYQVSQAIEIGEGGMLLESCHALAPEALICLSFYVPQKGFITTLAQVAYTKQEGSIGLKFLSLEFEYRRAIRDYIAQKTALEAKELN